MGDQSSTSKLNGMTASGVSEEIIDLTDSPDVHSVPLTTSGQRAFLDDSVIILSDGDSSAAPSGPGSRSLSNPATSLKSSDGFGAKDTGTSRCIGGKGSSAGSTTDTASDPFQSVATSSTVAPSTSGSFGGLQPSTTAIQSGQQRSMQGDGGGGNSGYGHPPVLLKSASIPVVMIPRCAAPISTKGHAVPVDPGPASSLCQPGTAVVTAQPHSQPLLFSSSVSPGDSAGLCRSMGVSAMLGTLLSPQLMHPSTSKSTETAGGIQGISLPPKTLSDPGPSTSKLMKDSQHVSSSPLQVSAKKASDDPEPMDIDPDRSPVPVTTAQLAKSTSSSALPQGSNSTGSGSGSQASGWARRLRAVPSRRQQQQPVVGRSASHSNTGQLGPAKGIAEVAKPADGSGLSTIAAMAVGQSATDGPAHSVVPGSVDNGSKSADHMHAVAAQSVPINPVTSSLVNSNKVDVIAPNSVKHHAQTCDQKSTSACSSTSVKDKNNSHVACTATFFLSQNSLASSSHTSNLIAISSSGSSSSGVALSLPAATATPISSTGAATNATAAAAATRTQQNLLLFDNIGKAQINARPQLIAHRRVKGNRYLNTAFLMDPDKPNTGTASSKSAKSNVHGTVVEQKNTKMKTAAATGSEKKKETAKKIGVDVEFTGSRGNAPATTSSNGWTCRQCTFINHPDLGRCEMCELRVEDSLDTNSVNAGASTSSSTTITAPSSSSVPSSSLHPSAHSPRTRRRDDNQTASNRAAQQLAKKKDASHDAAGATANVNFNAAAPAIATAGGVKQKGQSKAGGSSLNSDAAGASSNPAAGGSSSLNLIDFDSTGTANDTHPPPVFVGTGTSGQSARGAAMAGGMMDGPSTSNAVPPQLTALAVQPVISAPVPVQPPPGWNCSRCTYFNHDELDVCEMCAGRRFAPDPGAVGTAAPPMVDGGANGAVEAEQGERPGTAGDLGAGDVMPVDWLPDGTAGGQFFVRLENDDPEFLRIHQMFTEHTGPNAAKLLSKIYKQWPFQRAATVTDVFRIENYPLLLQFRSNRSMMDKGLPVPIPEQYHPYVRTVYHGTDRKTAYEIGQDGFNRSFAGMKTGKAYGDGTYFAPECATAAQYGIRNGQPNSCVFECEALTGIYSQGKAGLKKLPYGVHSAVDDIKQPSMFIFFTEDVVYPKYCIYFKL